ncbi:hypothetical protein A3860_36625 [Niastella vici]|uniref:Uncharacterized protein n=1 Tax=Niastella vici TaxID=1703345 RepID=A0A1V9FMP6_9BACT|nr:hypothetical protein [Niastella vici]OQP59608.1 hypothetical protein A3860_36625 [Niastella vici]
MRHFVRNLTLLMFVLLSKEMFAQNERFPTITKQEMANFLNSFYQSDSFIKKLRFINVAQRPTWITDLPQFEIIDSVFTELDISFFKFQLQHFQSCTFNSSYIAAANFMDEKDFNRIFSVRAVDAVNAWDVFHKKYGLGYTLISWPVFSKDKMSCVLFVEYTSNRSESTGALKIYKKENSSWKLFKEKYMWGNSK